MAEFAKNWNDRLTGCNSLVNADNPPRTCPVAEGR
jgi:hypothetical protein